MKKKIEIKYHDSQLSRIEKISVGDWIDLRTAENVALHEGDFKLNPTRKYTTVDRKYEVSKGLSFILFLLCNKSYFV